MVNNILVLDMSERKTEFHIPHPSFAGSLYKNGSVLKPVNKVTKLQFNSFETG